MPTDLPVIQIVPGLLLGWLCGGLVNYLSDVLPQRRRPVAPFCLGCQAPLPWWHYLLPRPCPGCTTPPRRRAWLVLVVFALAGAWMLAAPPQRLGPWLGLVWLVYFGVIIVIDVEHHLILHPVSWAGAGLGLLTGWWLHGWLDTLLGGLGGFGIMLAFYWLGMVFARWLKRRRGEEIDEDEALGFGDVNLSGVIGLLLGWPGVVAGLILAVLLGGLISLVYLVFMAVRHRYRLAMAVPYGPFLALAAIWLLYLR